MPWISEKKPIVYLLRGATDFIDEGQCPSCKKRGSFLSYIIPWHGDAEIKEGRQNCGYVCFKCGWGNAGSREVHDGD